MKVFYCLTFLILFLAKVFGEQRLVKSHQFTEGEYYDTIKYEFDITDTQKIGKLDYEVSSSDGAVATLIMNSTEYYDWTTKYYPQWIQQPEYNFEYLNEDLKEFMCRAPVAACTRIDVKYPDRKLYVVIVKDPRKEETSYEYRDDVGKYQNSTTVAKLVYDPLNPPVTQTTVSASYSSIVNSSPTASSVPTNSSSLNTTDILTQPNINNNSTNLDNIDNNKNSKDIKDERKNSKSYWYWYLIGGLALLLILGSLMFALTKNKKKPQDNSREVLNDENLVIQNNSGNESDGVDTKAATVISIPYNPHHAVKRVAYNYKSDDVSFERDNIIEITKRYNDGWASAINPKDGKEYLIPLIILEGDLNEDLANIPYEEKKF